MANNLQGRSWNDPPVLKFEGTGLTGKHHLNKRVFSPLNKQDLQDTSPKDVEDRKDNTKPVNKLPTSSTVVNNRVEENLEEDSKDNCDIPDSDEEILNCVMSTFRNILQESTSKSERPLKEIDRRINLMGKAWKSDLSKEVKHMMYKMAKDLSTGNIDSAEKLHCAIMVQNVREVKNWMVGVKHIIEMKRENQNLLNS
ncbi:UNVERIFIED_CONTAM: Sra1 [Trichonephila clavipes]